MATLDDILTVQKNAVVALSRIAQGLVPSFPFNPVSGGAGLTLTAGVASSNGTLVGASLNAPYAQVCNQGTVWVFVQFGDSTVTATTASMAVPPGSCALVTITPASGAFPTHMAAITAAATAEVQVSMGYSGT